MKWTRFSSRPAAACILAFVATGWIACSGGSSGGGGDALAVVEFLAGGTDGLVRRNEPIEIVFNANIDPRSVSVAGLRVRAGGVVHPGRIEVDGKRILWSSVVLPGDRNDYEPPNYPPINGLGFAGGTRYTVELVGNHGYSVRSKGGQRLEQEFRANFTSSVDFLPEDVPDFPFVLKDSSPVFDPPPLVDGDPFSPDPMDWPVLDPSRVVFRVNFTEPMHPDRLDPAKTFTVTNVTDVPEAIPGVGTPALVDLELAPEADKVYAHCLTSLGDDPFSDEPWIYEVRLTSEITDLAGTRLPESVVFHFKTADKPGERNYHVVTETFDDDAFLDPVATTANWGYGGLRGADTHRRLTSFVPQPQTNFALAHPLVEDGNIFTPNGCRFQMRFTAPQIGAEPGDSIIGMSWSPQSNITFSGTYRDVTIKLGHHLPPAGAGLYPNFEGNYFPGIPDNPLVVYEGDYTVGASTVSPWVPWPEFTVDFLVDPSMDLTFEFDMPKGGDTYQLFRNSSTGSAPWNRIYANGGAAVAIGGPENTQYDQQFDLVRIRSVGQSVGYEIDAPIVTPDYGPIVVDIGNRPAGTDVKVSWAYATPGQAVPNPSDFIENLNVLDGAPSVAFRVQFSANPFTGSSPEIHSIRFAVRDSYGY